MSHVKKAADFVAVVNKGKLDCFRAKEFKPRLFGRLELQAVDVVKAKDLLLHRLYAGARADHRHKRHLLGGNVKIQAARANHNQAPKGLLALRKQAHLAKSPRARRKFRHLGFYNHIVDPLAERGEKLLFLRLVHKSLPPKNWRQAQKPPPFFVP